MRILFATSSAHHVGGCETYVESALSGLPSTGHAIACLFEDSDTSLPQIQLPSGAPSWVMSAEGPEAALRAAAKWRPDVVYAHAFLDPVLEAAVQSLAPAVLFAHGYYGTCISGGKMWTRPRLRACNRAFGVGCLLHYFPHGCGGRSPTTMFRHFRLQQKRQALLRRYRRILVASRHMADEFRREQLPAEQVQVLPLPFVQARSSATDLAEQIAARVATFEAGERPVRLLFMGRLEWNKGCALAMAAAAIVARTLARPVELTIAGDGSLRASLAKRAAIAHPATVQFAGWLGGEELPATIAAADLLIVPSVWPEPFGLVGLEAAVYGVPAVAFAHGGIVDWLVEGVNGATAPAAPPSAAALAEAALRCLDSSDTLLSLSLGAVSAVEAWPNLDEHVRKLVSLLEDARA